jgi:LAGLIDADG endonuclease
MITWQYLAGFFDGEGSVSITSNHRSGFNIAIQLPQSGIEGLALLTTIREFLMEQGIQVQQIYTRDKSSPLSKKTDNRLQIGNRDSSIAFLKSILPFVQIKKSKVEDAIRFAKLFPKLPKGGRLTWESRRTNQLTV